MLARVPHLQAPGVHAELRAKARVLYFPLVLPAALPSAPEPEDEEGQGDEGAEGAVAAQGPLCIVWNHRWEYDKRPGTY